MTTYTLARPAMNTLAAAPVATPTLDDGAIRLTVRTPGSAGLVVLFVRALSQHPQVRFARMEGSVRDTAVEMLLTLTAPVPLTALLQDMPGVNSVRHVCKAGSEASSSHMEVVLARAGAGIQAA